jgi:hypothetical protein
MDGAGNVYVADFSAAKVYMVTPGGTQTTVGSAFGNPASVAVDGPGNVYIADAGLAVVYELMPDGTQTTVGSGFVEPAGVAVDGAGNVYVADPGVPAVYKVAPGGTQTMIGSGFSKPESVVVDAAGNVYIVDADTDTVYEVTPDGVQSTASSGFDGPTGLAMGETGNLYVSNTGESRVVMMDRADGPSLSFSTTNLGSTSSDSPRTVQIVNVGNRLLIFTGLLYAVDFPYAGSGANPCTSSTSLSAGGECELDIDFSPLNAGTPLTEHIVLTDNNLNGSYVSQSIPLSGSAQGTPVATANAISAVRNSAFSGLVATFTYPGSNQASIADFSVTINWGDGTFSAGPVTQPGGVGTPYVVSGSHTYTSVGSYTFTVTVQDLASDSDQASNTATVLYPLTVNLETISTPVNFGVTTSLKAGFSIPSGAPVPASLTMRFYINGGATLLGSATLSATGDIYSATLPASSLPAGSQTIFAYYPGDNAAYASAQSPGQTVYVIANMLWIGNPNVVPAGSTSVFLPSGTAYLASAEAYGGTGVAVDNSGSVWSLNQAGNTVHEFSSSGAVVGSPISGNALTGGTSLAIDGSNQVWIPNSSGGTLAVFSSGGTQVTPNTGYTVGTSAPTSIAIDISGNVWVVNSSSNSVTKVLGAAAPTIPLATGVATGKPATEP